MVTALPFDTEKHDYPAPWATLWVAVAISALAHLGVVLFWFEGRGHSHRGSFPLISQQIHIVPRALEPVVEPIVAAADEPLTDPDEPVAEPTVADSQLSPAHPSEPDEQTDVPSPVAQRRSILQSVDDYVSGLPLSSEYLPQEAPGDPGTIFNPTLRRALRAPGRLPEGTSNPLLNNSTVADAYERVALDGKCFRLADLGGGGDRRAWYPVKCIGTESTSDAMARGLEEALKRR